MGHPHSLLFVVQRRPATGGSHVQGQARTLRLCQGQSIPELLRADPGVQPADEAPAKATPRSQRDVTQ